MKPRFILVAAVFVALPGRAVAMDEPAYEGKPVSYWISGLKSKEETVRQKAISVLKNVGPEADQAVPTLIECLREDDFFVRKCVVGSIRRIRGDALPTLIQALSHKDAKIRAAVAFTLGRSFAAPPKIAIPALTSCMKDRDALVRIYAAEALWKVDEKVTDVIPVLVQELSHKDSFIRALAAEVIGNIGPQAESAALPLAAALKDKNSLVRIRSAAALCGVERKELVPVPLLVDSLGSNDERVRRLAVYVAGKVGQRAKEVENTLSELLKNKDPGFRCSVAFTLWEVSGHATKPIGVLLGALKDETYEGRTNVFAYLSMMGPQAEAVPDLVALLKDRDPSIRINACGALGEIGPGAKGAVPALVNMLKDREANARGNAAFALGKIGKEAKIHAVPTLTGLLKDEDAHVRVNAAMALWRLDRQTEVALRILIPALGQKEGFAALSAIYALGAMGPDAREAIPELKKMLDHKNHNLRSAAAEALKTIDPKAAPLQHK